MSCINLLNSREGPRSLDCVITTYSYPLLTGGRKKIEVRDADVLVVLLVVDVQTVHSAGPLPNGCLGHQEWQTLA